MKSVQYRRIQLCDLRIPRGWQVPFWDSVEELQQHVGDLYHFDALRLSTN